MPFSDAVRSKLSMEAGGFCANPECQTITGIFVPGRTLSGGDGAHIVAEKPDGPRGQSPLTPEERAMESNGVWLCPTCHRKVDIVRPEDYSVELLQQWKVNARIWWQQNQGRQLQVAARPDVRPQVPRPSPHSLLGAKKFWQAHQPLANALWNLRWQSPAPFERDVPIPVEIEQQIRQMSSSPKMGLNWKHEWGTTFHCEDQELLGHMQDLIRYVDSILRPLGSLLDGPLRRVNFKQTDVLAQGIENYTNAWDAFGKCLRKYENWGL